MHLILFLNHFNRSNPQKFPSQQDIIDFKDFIAVLSNLTFENVVTADLTKTYDIDAADYMNLIDSLSFSFNPKISLGTSMTVAIQSTITELGICYSVNSKHAIYNSLDYWKSNKWNFMPGNDTVMLHPLDGEIFIQIINISSAYDVYFHGATEIPEISKQRLSFTSTDYSTVELLALEILTTESVKA